MDDKCKASTSLTVLTALAAEAEALAGRKKRTQEETVIVLEKHSSTERITRIVQCGIGCDTLLRIALPQIQDTAIVGNIGVSGGLAPDLEPGTVILGDQIVTSTHLHGDYRKTYAPSVQLLDSLEATLKKKKFPYRRGALLCSLHPLESPEEKAAAYLKTGALAVDMESAGAARAAGQAGLPFFCIRVVCDPARRRVAEKLFAGVDTEGNNQPMRLIKPLLREPWLLIQLLGMARDFNCSLSGMRQVWKCIRNCL